MESNFFRKESLLFTVILIIATFSCQSSSSERSLELQSAPLKNSPMGPEHVVAWGANPLWDDGLAEVAIYDTERIQYGKLRKFETALITVKEDFNKQYYVKADWPFDGKEILSVLKLNISFVMPTENYDYHHLVSVFVPRDNVLKPIKMTVGSQEWCGNTFKEFKNWKRETELTYHSYFEADKGDGTFKLEFREGDFLDEQLFLSLRSLPFEKGYKFDARIMDPQISNRAKQPNLTDAEIMVEGEEEIKSGIGKVNCWKVEARKADGERLTFWFEKEYPNVLVKFEASDQRKFLLKGRTRRAYWIRPSS